MTTHIAKSLKKEFDLETQSKEDIKEELLHILVFYFSKTPETALPIDWLHAVTILIRGFTFYKFNQVKTSEKTATPKFVNYLSMEFLIGRTLLKSIQSLGISEVMQDILADYKITLQSLENNEPEPGLGNGGLGRLAACFMDSMAALGISAFGYGIRYDYGMFSQKILDGRQVEYPDMWLLNGYMWEIHRPEVKYLVPFYGKVSIGESGESVVKESKQVFARAYDILIPSEKGAHICRVRLWSASTNEELVLEHFNVGDYARAFYQKNNAENISSVLYPDDRTDQGKELRLKQEYFFASASVQDILFRFTCNHSNFDELPNREAIHLNDTHPALAIPEMMRILTGQYSISWEKAWKYCEGIFSYTNHTLLPEALETWGVKLFENMLPQVLTIIYRINADFLDRVRQRSNLNHLLGSLSVFEENGEKKIRMANLCLIMSHKVNGVSKLHSQLMTESIFKDFYLWSPEKFCNVTNGITPRRWLFRSNPGLTELINKKLGTSWHQNFKELENLKNFAKDPAVQNEFLRVKSHNKQMLAEYVQTELGITLSPEALFDVHIKRIHEYKRQLLNILHIIYRYNLILSQPNRQWIPRCFIIGGKAASAYYMAKLIIRFVNDVAYTINNDMRVSKLLKLVFIPDYSVKLAELIIPAADISEQISTAGLEASGTGNMKLSLNGALTIGTLDGANIEIREKTGEENFFLVGNTVQELGKIRQLGYDPLSWYENNLHLRKVVDQIRFGFFSPMEEKRYADLVNSLLHSDHFMIFPDFDSYCEGQNKVDELYAHPNLWAEKALLNVGAMAYFSSDRAIAEYATMIWNVPHREQSF